MDRLWHWILAALLTALSAYFLGCSNGAVLISKYILRDDIRRHGSGNAGLTNFLRTFGGPLTLAVIAIDVVKAVASLLLALLFSRLFLGEDFETLAKYWAALFCMLGHMFPCMFRFQGGKGILSGGTAVWMLDWRVALVVWVGFLLLTVLTRYVSLGSCWAGASFPFATYLFQRDWRTTALSTVVGALILYKHRGNIQRLLSGTENKLSLHRKKGGT